MTFKSLNRIHPKLDLYYWYLVTLLCSKTMIFLLHKLQFSFIGSKQQQMTLL